MIPHEELTSNADDDMRFQRIIVEEMGELLPGKLLAECDLTHARSLLEIGSGASAWLRAAARLYPDLQCIGIDQDELQVKAANALAQRDQLAQVAFLTTDMNDVSPALFSPGTFDLVHLGLLGRYILTVNYSALAQTCAALCRPGGIMCWTEAELPLTTSPACEHLTSLVCEALQRAGKSFIPESTWELAEHFLARSGIPVIERSSYKRRHLGITPMLGRWLRDAGCGGQRETPTSSLWRMDDRVIHETAYAIEVSVGQPAHEGFVRQARHFAQHVKPFLLRTEVIEGREHAALCDQLATELTNQDFCGLSFLLRAWAPRP